MALCAVPGCDKFAMKGANNIYCSTEHKIHAKTQNEQGETIIEEKK